MVSASPCGVTAGIPCCTPLLSGPRAPMILSLVMSFSPRQHPELRSPFFSRQTWRWEGCPSVHLTVAVDRLCLGPHSGGPHPLPWWDWEGLAFLTPWKAQPCTSQRGHTGPGTAGSPGRSAPAVTWRGGSPPSRTRLSPQGAWKEVGGWECGAFHGSCHVPVSWSPTLGTLRDRDLVSLS